MFFAYLFILFMYTNTGFTANKCNFDVKLQQDLHNQGFHRNITYKVLFGNKYGDVYQYEKCLVGIDQTLPAGIYANPDELSDLKRMQKLSAIPKNRVNVELPAEQSLPMSVYIMGKLTDREVNLWLPVHARYHQAAHGGGFAHNRIAPPQLYIRCPHIKMEHCEPKSSLISFLCHGNTKDTCSWKQISYTALTQPLTMSVPIGDTSHYNIVASVTMVTAIIFSLYLLKTLHEHKLASVKKKS